MFFVFFVSSWLVLAQQQSLPRFRSGASLVTVDAYVSRDGKPITDLKQDEVEILEDGNPQSIEAFRLIHAGGPSTAASAGGAQAAASMTSTIADGSSRTFVLFFDTWHVSSDGSRRAAAPVSALLNRVIGLNDKVGVMTPGIPARSLDLTSRASAIDRLVRNATDWGQRDSVGDVDPREREIALCYPENDMRKPQYRGIAKEMIERRREEKTLTALNELIERLATLGDERKFVVVLTEGWVLFQQNASLARVLGPDSIPSPPPIGRGTQGGLTRPEAYDRGFNSCERERSLLAFVDHAVELRQMAQRANRANVSFYAIDPRGLTAFDDSIGPMQPATPAADRSRMASRQGGLRELADNTDGAVVLNTNDVTGGVARMMSDLGSYYVMQYYSTNPKRDGRFRSIVVHVKRPATHVRARNGYLALSEAEARALTAPTATAAAAEIKKRLPMTALKRGPGTGRDYVRAEQSQFRRTERMRIEVVLPAGATNPDGHVLTSQAQELPLPVTYSTAQVNGETVSIFDVALAPLAAASYVMRVSYGLSGARQSTDYEFRIVP